MRGTLCASEKALACEGIIPAYAGNTSMAPCPPWAPRDHPRVCGEHSETALPVSFATGSSPRMRGTLAWFVGATVDQGIIPAYAGNTHCRRTSSTKARDHPRVCGEHTGRGDSRGVTQGSSPRMRGTPITTKKYGHAVGIIPAYAGNTTFR